MIINYKTRLVHAAAGALFMSLMGGCASNLTEDEKLAIEYERVERQVEIREFMASCERAGNVVLYTGPVYHKLRDPVKHIPSHARRSEYACTSAAWAMRGIGME